MLVKIFVIASLITFVIAGVVAWWYENGPETKDNSTEVGINEDEAER